MPWRPLRAADGAAPAKLSALRRAQRARLVVPPTVWAPRDEAPAEPPLELGPAPWILRSAAFSEDAVEGSRAGHFTSRVVTNGAEYASALQAVLDSMKEESPRSCVFAQPFLHEVEGADGSLRAGVVFFNGFYFESASARGGNQELTAGHARGDVLRGAVRRGDPFSAWLLQVARVFRSMLAQAPAIDIEYAELSASSVAIEDASPRFILLQIRPARFELAPNRTLSLANHREILGDPPSPWIASALDCAGRDAPRFFAAVEPAIADWREPYALLRAGRAWLNVSLFQRLMDRWGLPRTYVTEGVGGAGDVESAAADTGKGSDDRILWRRFLPSVPHLMKLQVRSLWTTLRRKRALTELEEAVDAADDLRSLFQASVVGLDTALVTNFAINGVWTGVARIRRALRIRGSARVVTESMRADYDALRQAPRALRAEGLERWLLRFGHRGPLESDLARPRFRELRETLRLELESAPEAADPAAPLPGLSNGRGRNPLYWIDRVRESFRSELMKRFEPLRAKLLEESGRLVREGHLDRVEDVFLLDAGDVRLAPSALRKAVQRRKSQLERERTLDLPGTTSEDALRSLVRSGVAPGVSAAELDAPRAGIGITPKAFEGIVRRADDLVELLREVGRGDATLTRETVLVVPALEPSWAVLFDRVGAVVAELGGELSHASILLREIAKPAVVNLPGIFQALNDGDRVGLDGEAGTVTLMRRA